MKQTLQTADEFCDLSYRTKEKKSLKKEKLNQTKKTYRYHGNNVLIDCKLLTIGKKKERLNNLRTPLPATPACLPVCPPTVSVYFIIQTNSSS